MLHKFICKVIWRKYLLTAEEILACCCFVVIIPPACIHFTHQESLCKQAGNHASRQSCRHLKPYYILCVPPKGLRTKQNACCFACFRFCFTVQCCVISSLWHKENFSLKLQWSASSSSTPPPPLPAETATDPQCNGFYMSLAPGSWMFCIGSSNKRCLLQGVWNGHILGSWSLWGRGLKQAHLFGALLAGGWFSPKHIYGGVSNHNVGPATKRKNSMGGKRLQKCLRGGGSSYGQWWWGATRVGTTVPDLLPTPAKAAAAVPRWQIFWCWILGVLQNYSLSFFPPLSH